MLSGCKENLYTGLSERQANAMLSVLLNGGIDTVKRAEPKDTFAVMVERDELARAVDLLDAEGLPGDDFVDMAQMYKKEGLISSPMEERVRYTFVLSQSIAETLTNIDGILTARVHIALPEKDAFTGELDPSSASVFIKYRNDYRFDDIKPEIKRIVESSIEGLSYDRIAVFMSASQAGLGAAGGSAEEALVAFGPLTMKRGSVTMVKILLIVTLTLFALLAAAALWMGRRLGIGETLVRRVRALRRPAGNAPASVEPADAPTGPSASEEGAPGKLRSIVTFRKSA